MDRSPVKCLMSGPVTLSFHRTSSSSDDGRSAFKASSVFVALDKALKEDTEGSVEKARGIYGFKVKNKEGKEALWIVNAKTGKGSVEFNGKDKPEVTIAISDEDVIDLLSGKLNPQKAYFQGKIKITGNMGLAMKLTNLMKTATSKLDILKAKL